MSVIETIEKLRWGGPPIHSRRENARRGCVRSSRRIAWSGGLWLGVALVFFAPPAFAATAGVQYLSETTIYLDAGAAVGLQKSSEVRVLRDGQVVAVLEVEFVAQHSAACRVLSGGGVRVGDRVEFEPVVDPGVSTPAGGEPTSASRRDVPSVWSRLGHVRGRVATYYTRAEDPEGTYQNPTATALLRWTGAGQQDLSVRVRGDRPSFAFSDPEALLVHDAARVRMFEARVRYRSASAQLDLEGGRFLPRQFEGIGSVDGGSATWRPTRALRLGAAGGRSVTNGVRGFASHGGVAYGAFVGTSHGTRQRRWSALASWTELHDTDVARRQFAVVRSDASIGVLRLVQRVEIDANPQWKRELGEKDVVLTAWSLGNELRFRSGSGLAVAVDSRRPLLLPEVRDTSDTVLLQRWYGVRASLRLALGRAHVFRGGGRYGWRADDDATTRSWDAGLVSSRLFRDGVSGSVRVDGHDSGTASSANVSTNLRWRLSSRLGLAAAAGVGRQESQAAFLVTSPTQRDFGWLRVGADLHTTGGLWLDVSNEWQGRERGNELALGVGRVF